MFMWGGINENHDEIGYFTIHYNIYSVHSVNLCKSHLIIVIKLERFHECRTSIIQRKGAGRTLCGGDRVQNQN